MKARDIIWIIVSVGIIEFDLGNIAETNMYNLLEWVLIDIPLLLGLWWLLNRRDPKKDWVLKGVNDEL